MDRDAENKETRTESDTEKALDEIFHSFVSLQV